MEQVVAELRGTRKTTVRLHPRRGNVPELSASKVGGEFLWPDDEPWPTCDEHNHPYVAFLQLRLEDVPELDFTPPANLFQLLWCPRDHDPPRYSIYWRSDSSIQTPLMHIPKPELSHEETSGDDCLLVPVPCRLHPERVEEYPDFRELPLTVQEKLQDWDLSDPDMKERLEEWGPLPFAPGEWLYNCELSVAPGSKIGGYVNWIQWPETPICKCQEPMDHFLTVSTLEPMNDRRWCPLEDRKEASTVEGEEMLKLCHVTGLSLGDGGCFYFFECRRCEARPTTVVFQCG